MSEQFITYFGFGSLVNRATRPADEQAFPARLYGWQRVWGHRVTGSSDASSGARQSCCSLSVEPADSPNAFIDGVIVKLPVSDLPILDKRESGYDRVQVSANDFDLPPECTCEHIHVYVSDQDHAGRSNDTYPILQSYIDCVLSGYCSVFEQSGMQHFIDTTVGWEGVIDNDRASPKYPRAVKLEAKELASIDTLVKKRRLS